MKSFIQYLAESEKIYEFKIKIACETDSAMMDRIEATLNAFQLKSISRPKRLPIQEDAINFPRLGPVEISVIDVAVAYPASPDQIRSLLSDRANVPRSHCVVYTKHQEGDRTLPEVKEGPTLGVDDPEAEKVLAYGDEYNEKMLGDLKTREMPFAADSAEGA